MKKENDVSGASGETPSGSTLQVLAADGSGFSAAIADAPPHRPIKFRAWNFETKEMRIVTGLALDMQMILWRLSGEFTGAGAWVASNCHLMQFTGLKDNNGRDIYEGDIILHGTGRLRGPGEVQWSALHVGFKVYRKEKQQNYDIYSPEVIGNIYENPELLQP